MNFNCKTLYNFEILIYFITCEFENQTSKIQYNNFFFFFFWELNITLFTIVSKHLCFSIRNISLVNLN